MSPSVVLAALRGSTYRETYASPLRLLRPRWVTILNILQEAADEATPSPSCDEVRSLMGVLLLAGTLPD